MTDLRNLRTSLVKNKIKFVVIFFTLNLMICLYMVGAVFFNTQFLMKRYTKSLGVTKALHMSREELLMATDTTINLIKGRSHDYEFKAFVKGLEDTFLSQKEIRHVKELASAYQVGRGVFFCMGLLIVLLLIWVIISLLLWKRRGKSLVSSGKQDSDQDLEHDFVGNITWKDVFGRLCTDASVGFIIAQSAFILILSFIVLYFLKYPNTAINKAHKLVFKGDNWVLNPVNNRLIYMCPSKLIEECIFIVCRTMGIYIGIGLIISVGYLIIRSMFKNKG